MIPVFVATLVLFNGVIAYQPETKDDAIGCFLPGECLNSLFVNVTSTTFLQDCHDSCKEQEVRSLPVYFHEMLKCSSFTFLKGCDHFTYYESSGTCFLFSNCNRYSAEDCQDDCISGDVGCQDLKYVSVLPYSNM